MQPLMENTILKSDDGIIKAYQNGELIQDTENIPTMIEYIEDVLYILELINNKINKTVCQERIQLLRQKFTLHQTLNNYKEILDQRKIYHRDFYNTVKVDTHIHHSASMNALKLLKFIKRKLINEPDAEVYKDNETGKIMTLKQVFDRYGIKEEHISLDTLNVKADRTLYQRFDNFNNKYNPLGQPVFREIFMKTDNFINGKYIAEITQNVIERMEKDQYVYTEWRLSIYGKNTQEWNKLACWVVNNKLQSKYNRWMIQIPRLYQAYKKAGFIQNFQDMIDNIFKPLFEITINPEIDPILHQFLATIGGFDTVDDESAFEQFYLEDLQTPPNKWTKLNNPHYAYWIYYIYANITSLNILRRKRNLNCYSFRPHCGEAGNIDHLVSAFLLADSINHGILLEKSPVLLYMFYLKQIGLAMSPLSNNKLFMKYEKQPFYKFFQIGVNVSISTDDPLILHMTNDPLLEEYSIASQIWDLSTVDLAELARNSVMQSSFEYTIKNHWAGDFKTINKKSNRPAYSNLPQSRFIYRLQNLNKEYEFLNSLGKNQ
ncbi:hypothetical protein IMG5_098540 [Ichthyophthirius multifiliis]|uniref:AMP deaminase n=1 Tax=Ichthyophthirius multifiliis TaxID=5932 RepID=G0QRY8_ICHMU|nr:hypothetical protein IMG5_098540 [Ichthyophthirius multifiliis]EGR32018.1 hypothetical protein IMG5_098540 [Ichthyophthirius multifiliis]|eukprot:XP_004035504.1 hypothetical protein IMG5_098540 [Ichthyophthirius multifiliis]